MLPSLQAMYSDIFLPIPSSFMFKNAAQDLLNEFHNSLMGHNTRFETCCPRGLTGILLGLLEEPQNNPISYRKFKQN